MHRKITVAYKNLDISRNRWTVEYDLLQTKVARYVALLEDRGQPFIVGDKIFEPMREKVGKGRLYRTLFLDVILWGMVKRKVLRPTRKQPVANDLRVMLDRENLRLYYI